jgi:hypothetical protein
MTIETIPVTYPVAWEHQYTETGNVAVWLMDYPDLFPRHVLERRGRLSANLGQLDLFPQYALQYQLRRQHGIESRSWYKIACTSPAARERAYIDGCWAKMRRVMRGTFSVLQKRLIAEGFRNLAGEPDLFCWHPRSGAWFFAEAKRRDNGHSKQQKWFHVFTEVVPETGRLRLYELRPEGRTQRK